MEQPIDPTEIDECAVIGEVLDHTIDDLSRRESPERVFTELLTLGLQQGTAREDDVPASLIELDHLEFEALIDDLLEISHWTKVDLRSREKCLDTDVDGQPALHPSNHDTLDRLATIACPTLIVCGRNDIVTPPKFHRELADGIRDARLVTLSYGGHLVMVESAERFNQTVLQFLEPST